MSWRIDIPQAVIEAAQSGDRAATERVASALLGPVYNLAMRFFGANDADDEAQNAVVHVLRVLRRYGAKSRFSTWCYRVVVNQFLNAKRKQLEVLTLDDGIEALDQGLEHHRAIGRFDAPDAQLLADEVKLSCTTALLVCLSRPLRMAYILGEILALPAPQAAAILEIRPPAFRKRLSLARLEVRGFLADRCGWVDRSNPCRCRKQIAYDLEVGWIRRDRLQYAHEKHAVERAKDHLQQTFDEASLYRSHPHYTPPPQALERALVVLDQLEGACETRGSSGARHGTRGG